MSETPPGVVIDVPAVLWDNARDGIDCPNLASVALDAAAGPGSWLDVGDDFGFTLDRAPDGTGEDQLTGFLVFLGLALVWSTVEAETIVLRRVERPARVRYSEPSS